MTEETFNEGFKIFKRFLKENNKYNEVLKFMFQHGRTKQNLFKEFNNKNYSYVDDWECVFNKINLLTGNLWLFDSKKYGEIISQHDLGNKWIRYYRKHIKKEINI